MKIAIVYFGVFLSEGGGSAASRRIRDIGRGLAALGHEVQVVVPRRSQEEHDVEVHGLQVRFLGRAGGNKLSKRIAYWSHLLRFAEEEGVDWVIFYNLLIDAFYPAILLRKNGIKVAAEFCDRHSPNFKWRDYKRWGLWASIKLCEELIPKASDLNICISSALIEHCKGRAPHTPRMILPVLVDPQTFQITEAAAGRATEKWDIPEDAIVITAVGSVGKNQGVASLIEAFAKNTRSHPQARLIIAGKLIKAATHDDVEALVQKLGMENKVIAPGWVATKQLVEIYSRSDILVIPMKNTKAIQAALPTKIAEYAQMGKAIVSTNVSDIGVYFKDGESALLIEPGQPDEMARSLERLIEDPELRACLGANAKQVAAEHFDYRVAGRKLSQELIRLGGQRGQTGLRDPVEEIDG